MSFTGDLEHLPIVDVIQLLHATKKSGTLSIRSDKGESQLVFRDGYIASANHSNNSVRIGKILVGIGAITAEGLSHALQDQKSAGASRKPLIAMLIERGAVKKADAFKGLETLIEMTIVEILTWSSGTFSLDVDHILVSDEYRYFPEKLNQEFNLNTQNVLMDALRIYDEKKRDGLLETEFAAAGEIAEAAPAGEVDSSTLTADDLGLADLDQLERKIPGVFASLKDVDPAEGERQRLRELAPGLGADEQERLQAFLQNYAGASGEEGPASVGGQALTVILYSADDFFKHAVTTVCRHAGILVFTTNEEQYLDHIIGLSLTKGVAPILVIDCPETAAGFSAEQGVSLRRQKKEKYPSITTIQLAAAFSDDTCLQAFADGARAVLPRPLRAVSKERFVDDIIRFLPVFRSYLQGCAGRSGEGFIGWLRESLADLNERREAPEMAFALLQSAVTLFERALTLVVGQAELIAERGIGIRRARSEGATPPLGFKLPLDKPSVLQRVIEEGRPYFGPGDDPLLQPLFAAIGAPKRSIILLLPLQSRGRTISLTYADFGGGEPSAVPVEFLEILAGQAGLVLENAFYRKMLEKTAR